MKYLSNKNGFLGIDNKFDIKQKCVVIPFGLEKTVSYGGGTKNGPKEIIKASHQVELYDEELNCEPFKVIGVKTIKPFKINKNINKALKQISFLNQKSIENNLFPLTLGGEHSITAGCIEPFVKSYKNVTILQFDAHADLRNSYNNQKYSHAPCQNLAEVTSALMTIVCLTVVVFSTLSRTGLAIAFSTCMLSHYVPNLLRCRRQYKAFRVV